MRKHILSALALAATLSALSACSSLPAESPAPTLKMPVAFAPQGGQAVGVRSNTSWWTVFGDPVLNRLVPMALEANLDLRQATERLAQSRALAAQRSAERGPTGGLSLGGRAQQLSELEAPGLTREQRRGESAQAGVNLSWEIDLFGRLHRQVQAANLRSDAAASDLQALRLLIGAEVAQAWFGLNGAREQSRLARELLSNRVQTLKLVQSRVARGFSGPLDETRARSELAAAEAELPTQLIAEQQAQNRLAVLLGQSPSGLPMPAAEGEVVQWQPLALPRPDDWLRQRPDLVAAETRLRALSLDVEAIRAEFMPRLSLGGALGYLAGSVAKLSGSGSLSWWLAPTLHVPLLDRGRIQARLDAANAQQREALLHYRQRVLLATEELENAVVQIREGQTRLQALQIRALHATGAEELARRRFAAGVSDFLELLDAQRTAQQAQLGLEAALTQHRQQLVAFQRAAGASYEPTTQPVDGSRGPT